MQIDDMIIKELPVSLDLPEMVQVRQTFDAPYIEDIETTLREQLLAGSLKDTVKPGAEIAITAGSRGISNIAEIIRVTADVIRSLGGNPFVLSAMGSHGGYTESGQRALLADYGITEEAVGCPVECPTAVKEIGKSSIHLPIYFCERALAADGIIAVNRIKTHTDFTGATESGLLKILTIGLGRQPGANQAHRLGRQGLAELVPEIGKVLLKRTNVLQGIGIVENAYHDTAILEAIEPDAIPEREAKLLIQSKAMMAGLPVDDIDVLIVDEMGKNISGTGMDTNVIGRKPTMKPSVESHPNISQVAVLGLTHQTHGNACGLGYANVISRRLFESINFPVLHTNIMTAAVISGGKIPIIASTDELAIKLALYGSWTLHPEQARIIRITNTLSLKDIQVSTAVAESLHGSAQAECTGKPFPLEFDVSGKLTTTIS